MRPLLKRGISLAASAMILVQLSAQQPDSLVNLPNLLLPRFTKSIVVMKSGEKKTAVVNYNLVDQEMVFLQKGIPYILDNPELIDTVYLANRTFIPFDKEFLEIAVAAPVSLLIQHKCYVESPGVPTGYGAMSQTAAPNYVSKFLDTKTGAVNLQVPKDYKITDDTEYWIRKERAMNKFANRKQFLKLFPDKSKDLDAFISANRTDFKNQQKIVELVTYCNSLYK